MPDEKPTQHAETREGQGCPFQMQTGRCGRAIYDPPSFGQLCLMHSRDVNKDNAAFQAEFERTLQEAGDSTADFTGFVFPSSNYSNRNFTVCCQFLSAEFTEDADFSGATFTQLAIFVHAKFIKDAAFDFAKFMLGANFTGAKFYQDVRFDLATFTHDANFMVAQFTRYAMFEKATFTGATFSGASFTEDGNFTGAKFSYRADFTAATFTQRAMFNDTAFTENADFTRARFLGSAEFREAYFCDDGTLEPGPIFSVTYFEHPEAVTFYNAYLGQALFHNCDVSRFTFSDVRWRRRPNGKNMVFDEDVELGRAEAKALRPNHGDADERNYSLIAELYQQLKKNYDDRRDYWTAGDFHYGEMEMKRLHSGSQRKWVRWLHRRLGLAAWYKYASQYGESYTRPAESLGLALLLFGLLYPVFGLAPAAGAGPPIFYSNPCEAGIWQALLLPFFKGLLTSLEVASFQRDFIYRSDTPCGHLLRLLQLLVVSILVALFLLALRRQFRR
jgi:uncharacterized protein YjbI with pentapeptide repeats